MQKTLTLLVLAASAGPLLSACSSGGPLGATASLPGSTAAVSSGVRSASSPAPDASRTYVTIPTSDSIQTDLISTFPTGTFVAKNSFKTKFKIPGKPLTCGFNQEGPCNFYDAFTMSGNAITIDVSIPDVDRVYTLMNAYSPPSGQQIATIEFVGSEGATQTFDLVAGDDIRDFYHGSFANSLNNGIKGVLAKNAFTCDDPTNCLGGAGTGDVYTGEAGTYNIDEQEYKLSSAFKTQTLDEIVITDTDSSATPILLGITTKSVK